MKKLLNDILNSLHYILNYAIKLRNQGNINMSSKYYQLINKSLNLELENVMDEELAHDMLNYRFNNMSVNREIKLEKVYYPYIKEIVKYLNEIDLNNKNKENNIIKK